MRRSKVRKRILQGLHTNTTEEEGSSDSVPLSWHYFAGAILSKEQQSYQEGTFCKELPKLLGSALFLIISSLPSGLGFGITVEKEELIEPISNLTKPAFSTAAALIYAFSLTALIFGSSIIYTGASIVSVFKSLFTDREPEKLWAYENVARKMMVASSVVLSLISAASTAMFYDADSYDAGSYDASSYDADDYFASFDEAVKYFFLVNAAVWSLVTMVLLSINVMAYRSQDENATVLGFFKLFFSRSNSKSEKLNRKELADVVSPNYVKKTKVPNFSGHNDEEESDSSEAENPNEGEKTSLFSSNRISINGSYGATNDAGLSKSAPVMNNNFGS